MAALLCTICAPLVRLAYMHRERKHFIGERKTHFLQTYSLTSSTIGTTRRASDCSYSDSIEERSLGSACSESDSENGCMVLESESTEEENDNVQGMRFNFLQGSGVPFDPNVDELTLEHKEKFLKMKTRIEQALRDREEANKNDALVHPDDFNILRFLKADQYDVDQAVRRLLKTLAWRKEKGLEQIAGIEPADWDTYRKKRVRVLVGYDKHGRPLMVERIGQFFGSGDAPRALSVQQWLQCYIYDMSLLFAEFRQCSIRANREVSDIMYIGDLKGVRLIQSFRYLYLIKALTSEVEVHYPEIAGPIVLVNAPKFMTRLWGAAQRIIDPNILAKVQIYPNIPTEKLLEKIDKSMLPQELGGENSIIIPQPC